MGQTWGAAILAPLALDCVLEMSFGGAIPCGDYEKHLS